MIARMRSSRFGLAAGLLGIFLSSGPLACRRESRPDILLITFDSLRADRLGAYGSRLGLTPRLDAFARSALLFERAYCAIPLTEPSLVSAFTSRYPHETGVSDNGVPMPAGILTIPEYLQSRGYETAAVVSNPVLAWPQRLDSGFDHYDDELPEWDWKRQQPARRARQTTDAAVRMWGRHKHKPFFLWVHYMEPHGPYDAPPDFLEAAFRATPAMDRRLEPNSSNRGLGGIPKYQYQEGCHSTRDYLVRYNASVAYADSEAGRLLATPAIERLFSDGLVLVSADHGEALGEHDTWFAHGENVYQEALRVPLLVRGRGISPGLRRDIASLLDLFPSVGEYLGDSRAGERGRPIFLRESPADRMVVGETFPASSTAERYTGISDSSSVVFSVPGSWEYFNTPGQLVDLASLRPDPMRSLARRLRQELLGGASSDPAAGRPPHILSHEVVARLRSLGYLQ